jgi:carboxyl-terminal processing protease
MDLRYNGGGLLSEAVELTGLFIRRGPVVQVRNSTGQIHGYPDINPKVVYDGPLMVLTSRFSASASEIVAGALQNYGRALIIGDSSTHGKGSVQEVIEMKKITPRRLRQFKNLGATKLTIQKFYLPNGYSTQMKGVVSDIQIPSIVEYLPVGESDLPNALSWDTIRPAPFAQNSIDSNLLKKLREANQSRQETLEEFSFLTERINWSRLKQDEDMDERQTELAKLNYPETEVQLDSVIKSAISEEEKVVTIDEDTSEEKEVPKFDIHLREALRVLTDTLDLEPDTKHWEMTAQATIHRKAGKKIAR